MNTEAISAARFGADPVTTNAPAMPSQLSDLHNAPEGMPAAPAGNEFEHTMALLNGKVRFAGAAAGFIAPHAKYGRPPEMLKALRAEMKNPLPSEVMKRLKELESQSRKFFSDLNKVANKSGKQMFLEHVKDLARQGGGGADLSKVDGFSVEEFEAERETMMTAIKELLLRISIEAHTMVLPLLKAGAEAADRLLRRELKAEIDRCKFYGIPFEGPSEILRSLHAIAAALTDKSQSKPPAYWTYPSVLVCNLVDL